MAQADEPPFADLLVLNQSADPIVQSLRSRFASTALVDAGSHNAAKIQATLTRAQALVVDLAALSVTEVQQNTWLHLAQTQGTPLILVNADPQHTAKITGLGLAGKVLVVRSAQHGRDVNVTVLEESATAGLPGSDTLADQTLTVVRHSPSAVQTSALMAEGDGDLPVRVMRTWTVDGYMAPKSIPDTNQQIVSDIDFQITLYDTTKPQAAKWLKITTIGPGINPGTLVIDSDTDRGYYLEEVRVEMYPANGDLQLLALDKHTPPTRWEDGSYTRTTGFEVGIAVDGPSAGYNMGTDETLELSDFRITNDTSSNKAAWIYQLRKVDTGTPYNSWKDMGYFDLLRNPPIGMRTLPAQAKANLQIGSEAVYRAPGDFQGQIGFSLRYLATLRRVWVDGSDAVTRRYPLANWLGMTVDFSQVNYEGDLSINELNFTSHNAANPNEVTISAPIDAELADYENVLVNFYKGACGSQQSKKIGGTEIDVLRGFGGTAQITWDTDGTTGEQAIWANVTPQDGEINRDNNQACATVNLSTRKLFVDASAVGENTGSSWADAFVDLQSALTAVRGKFSTSIWVAEGFYQPTKYTDRSIAFELSDGVALYGGFPKGGGDGTFTVRNPALHPTILSGDIGIQGNPSDNSYNVVRIPFLTPVGPTTVLDGFTISDGNANGNPNGAFEVASGGGVFMGSESTMQIRNLIVEDNHADGGGAGMYISGSPTFTNVIFRSNTAHTGAGLFNASGNPTFVNVLFTGNNAHSSGYPYGEGGAIFSGGGNLTLINVTMSNNHAYAPSNGPALFSLWGQVKIINSIFWNNDDVHGIAGPELQPTVHNSLLQNYWLEGSADVLTTDPLFVATDDLRLRPGSPAIDVGDDALLLEKGIVTDLQGNPRRVAYGNGSAVVDLGAYEAIPAAVSVTAPSVAVENGTPVTLTLHLNSRPTAAVTIMSSTDGQTTVQPTTLTFTPDQWDTPQQVVVTAVDNAFADGARTSQIHYQISSDDLAYAGLSLPDSAVTVEDDERPAVLVTPSSINLKSGGSAMYQLVLVVEPTNEVVVEVTSDGGLNLSSTKLTFTPENWKVPQTITLSAVPNSLTQGSTTIHPLVSSSSQAYNDIPVADVQVFIERQQTVYLPLLVR